MFLSDISIDPTFPNFVNNILHKTLHLSIQFYMLPKWEHGSLQNSCNTQFSEFIIWVVNQRRLDAAKSIKLLD